MKNKKIGVLMGGLSNEREVSLKSGNAVLQGLRDAGFDAVPIDADKDLDIKLRAEKIETAYIALHGRFGEDGTVQGMLELLKIPYTGSSLISSAITIDKNLTRQILIQNGLNVAPGYLVNENDSDLTNRLPFPLVVKPSEEGSSVGVSIAKNEEEFNKGLKAAFLCSKNVVIEQFVAGKEIQVAVIDGVAIGAVEVEPHAEFYDYNAKYSDGGSTHHIPPRISENRIKDAYETAQNAFFACRCSGAV
ncbi:MAG: D-alanine--D-alanine ligase, partial [Deltaproteobacteria bacterium]|nr:D-alanine--D-alanine ligase [Deltaproteobacteria bacterium]